jgi:hypothetical protein
MNHCPFLKSLPITAAALSRRFGITVTFSGSVACTDGKNINLPSGVLTCAGSFSNEDVEMIKGYLDHEASHITCNASDMFEKIKHVQGPVKHFWNLLQDGRDERLFGEMYPGSVEHLISLAFRLDLVNSEVLSDATSTVSNHLLLLIRLYAHGIFQKEVAETEKVVDGLLGQPLREKIQAETKKGVFAVSYHEVLAAAERIVELLKDAAGQCPPPPEQAQESREGEGQGQGQGQDQSREDSPDDGDSPGPKASPSQNSDNSQNQNQGQSQGQGQSQSQGEDASDKGDSSDMESPASSQGSGKESENDDAGDGEQNQGQQTASREADAAGAQSEATSKPPSQNEYARNAQAIVQDDGYSQTVGGAELLNSKADHVTIGFQGPAKPVPLKEINGHHRVQALPDSLVYNTTVTLRTRLLGLLQSSERAKTLISKRGPKLVGRNLYKLATDDPRMFAKTQKVIGKRIAVHLLVDVSASMSKETGVKREGGRNGISILWQGNAFGESLFMENYAYSEFALAAAQAFADVVRSIPQVSLGISAFPGRSNGEVLQLLDHGSRLEKNPLWQFCVNGGTPLAEALWYAFLRVMPLTEERKVLVILSDGHPSQVGRCVSTIDLIRKSGIEVVGISLGEDNMEQLLPKDQYAVVKKAEDIAPAYFAILEKLLLDRRNAA